MRMLMALIAVVVFLPSKAQSPDSDSDNTQQADSLAISAVGMPTVVEETIFGDSIIISDDDPLLIKSEPTGINVSTSISQEEYTPVLQPPMYDNAAGLDTLYTIQGRPMTIYARPASWTFNDPWWHGMWINTSVYAGAFIGTLFVLECLPEDATSWNRAELQQDPFYKRWFDNVFKLGPAWDKDKMIFNFVLHPYAGAVYFMAARTCGFNFWRSFLYSAIISTVGWEFGIEACMERPSYQDLVVTPVIGSLMGEGFYRLKRLIVNRNYEVCGSQVFGHILAFFLDPVNEIVGLLSPADECRTLGPGCLHTQPLLMPSPGGAGPGVGFTLSATF